MKSWHWDTYFEQGFPHPAAAAAAKSLQSCLTLCDPRDGSPPGSAIPGILQARIPEWVTVSFCNACMHANLLQSCLTLCDPMDSSPPGSSIHRILQARILEWVAISFSLPNPRVDWRRGLAMNGTINDRKKRSVKNVHRERNLTKTPNQGGWCEHDTFTVILISGLWWWRWRKEIEWVRGKGQKQNCKETVPLCGTVHF